MSVHRSTARRRAAIDPIGAPLGPVPELHPIHRADRRLAEIRAEAHRALLIVAAALIAAPILSLATLMVAR